MTTSETIAPVGEATVPVTPDFRPFARAVAARFAKLSEGELFCAADGDKLYDAYLAAFPAGTNPTYRTRTVYDCQTCKRFIRTLGGLVGIKGGKVLTVWEGLDLPEPFATVAKVMDAAVRAAQVTSVFRTKESAYGAEYNYDVKTQERHDHFHGKVAQRHFAADADAKRGELATTFQVMKRGLTEIREADLETVLDLIDANGLYTGQQNRGTVKGFLDLRHYYKALGESDLYIWEHLGSPFARFRNTAIGTLLVELAEGKELDEAVKAFEKKVAPENYQRPTTVITQRMVDDAVATINRLDLGGAIARRYARMSDVSVNDVLFVDNDTRGRMKDGIAALLEGSVKKTTADPAKATPIAADDFLRTVLPGTKTLDVLVQNGHLGNFVSLTGADGPERLFKWDNNFAWSYDGDTADSVKQRVKAAGGNVAAKLRVSLSWFNTDDLDLHAATPRGAHIYFGNKQGILDVDMNAPGTSLSRTPVENLAFTALEDGIYTIKVHQYGRRETSDVGFAIEVECNGVLHQHSHAGGLTTGQQVECFQLHVKKGELVKVETKLPGGTSSQEKWGVTTETLVPVAAVMHSPNYWGDNAVGARHTVFALKGCKNPGQARGIYNEFLRPDLHAHRKVFEVLANKTKCPFAEDQVSGLGFTAARGDSVTVVVDGGRSYKLKF